MGRAAYGCCMERDLTEYLLAHHVGGAWRAPLGQRMVAVPGGAGRVVAAGSADLARAQALRAPAGPQAVGRIAAALETHAALFDGLLSRDAVAQFAHAVRAGGPAGLVTHPSDDPARLGAALGGALAQGAIYLPPVRDAVFAVRLTQVMALADMPPGAYALLQGYRKRAP